MKGYNIVFDRMNSQIGFGPLSTCPSIKKYIHFFIKKK